MKVNMMHGAGGEVMGELLQTLTKFRHNNAGGIGLEALDDGAVIPLNGENLVFTTDSHVVRPIFFPGGDIGRIAVCGTINDLAMMGGRPIALSCGMIIEEGFEIDDLARIVASMDDALGEAGASLVTGDTKVVEKGKGDKIFINTSGIGQVHPSARIHHRYIEPGDAVIISGKLAAHGIAIMSLREGLQFETDTQTDSVNLNHTVKNLLDEFGEGVKFLRDPTRGGLASTLNEISGAAKIGIDIQQNLLPIDEQVEGACEMLGLDPLYVANEGLFIAIVKNDIAEKVLQLLHKDPNGNQAALIGYVTDDHPGKVILKSRIGGRRVVNYLPGEQLPRIC